MTAPRPRDGWLFLTPSLAVLAMLFAAPMILLFVISFWDVRAFQLRPALTLDSWIRALTDYGALTLRTIGTGLLAGALVTALGLILAGLLRFRAGRWGDALLVVIMLTLFGGYLVKVYAWKAILGADGLVNQGLMAMGLTDAPVAALIYSRTAVLIALTHFLLPFAVLPIHAALRNVAVAGVEAGRDLGAGPVTVWVRVILPQVRAGLFTAFAFCFLLAAGDYVTPLLIGGSGGAMVGQFVLSEFSTRFDWPTGSAMSFLLLAACLATLAIIGLADRLLFGRTAR
jgi:spermidine/putrescine transport system permease protein